MFDSYTLTHTQYTYAPIEEREREKISVGERGREEGEDLREKKLRDPQPKPREAIGSFNKLKEVRI